jgi:hypothetical protein
MRACECVKIGQQASIQPPVARSVNVNRSAELIMATTFVIGFYLWRQR